MIDGQSSSVGRNRSLSLTARIDMLKGFSFSRPTMNCSMALAWSELHQPFVMFCSPAVTVLILKFETSPLNRERTAGCGWKSWFHHDVLDNTGPKSRGLWIQLRRSISPVENGKGWTRPQMEWYERSKSIAEDQMLSFTGNRQKQQNHRCTRQNPTRLRRPFQSIWQTSARA